MGEGESVQDPKSMNLYVCSGKKSCKKNEKEVDTKRCIRTVSCECKI